jgi:hypothetical protein
MLSYSVRYKKFGCDKSTLVIIFWLDSKTSIQFKMIRTKSALLFILTLLLLIVFLNKFSIEKLLNITSSNRKITSFNSHQYDDYESTIDQNYLETSDEHLFWFVQVN